MTPEELAEKIWDRSYMSLDELQDDLRELYNEGWIVGYAEAEAKLKKSASTIAQKGR